MRYSLFIYTDAGKPGFAKLGVRHLRSDASLAYVANEAIWHSDMANVLRVDVERNDGVTPEIVASYRNGEQVA